MEINRSLLPIKGHFFLYWGFMASAPPFVMVLARQMGVPLAVQGVVSAVVTAAAVLARPVIAALADSFPSRRKIIFLGFIGLMIASYNPLGYLPPLQPPPRLSGSLLPPPSGLDTPYFVVFPYHHCHHHRQHHPQRHRQDSPDECVVTSAWDCFASPYSRQEKNESSSYIPDSEVRFSIRLVEEARHKRLEGGESITEENENRPKKIENKLESENKLREGENKLEEGLSSNTEDCKGTILHNESRGQLLGVPRLSDLDVNETLVYKVEGPSDWRFTNAHNVSVECLGGELGTVGENGTMQEWSCGPTIVKQVGFWVYVACLVASYISATTVESISDAICCDSIGEEGHYGRQRVWGVLSYGLFGAVSGMLVDWRSEDGTVKDYRPAFILMTVCGTIDLLLSAASLKVPRLELQRKGVWTNLRPLLRRIHFLVFLVTTFLTGFFDGLDTGFLFVLQEDIAQKSSSESSHVNTAQGLTLLVQAISAIPFMFLGDWFVRRFTAERVMSAVLFMYSFRLLSLSITSYLEALWGTVVVEVINGPCFGLGYTAIVVHAAALAPRGLSTTVQSVVGVCYGTLGYAGASFVGGVVYEMVGGQWLYLLTGVAALVTWTLHLAHLKLCPPNIKVTKFEMAVAKQEEEPEVLQVMVSRDGYNEEAAQRKGGEHEGELQKKNNENNEAIEKRRDEDAAQKGKKEKEGEEKDVTYLEVIGDRST